MKRRIHAFTLVELLVVIGIIALLISILLPALNRARQTAQTIKCLAQLRQFGQVDFMYASDNKGFLFPAYWYTGGIYVQTILSPYFKLIASQTQNEQQNNYGSLSQRIYVCPTVDNVNTRQFPMTYGFNRGVHPDERPEFANTDNPINPHIGFYTDKNGQDWDRPLKQSQIRRPSETICMTDASLGAGGAAGYTGQAYLNAGWLYKTEGFNPLLSIPLNAGVPFTNPQLGTFPNGGSYAWAGNVDGGSSYSVRFRHNQNNACNAAFEDGHAATFTLKKDGKTSDMLAKNFATFY